jgi:AcrR family transcriptional regulator
MPKIAKRSGITPGNIYRYYNSKFELFYDVLTDWLEARMDEFEASFDGVVSPDDRLRRILVFMWIDLPSAENNFMVNLIEALSTKKETDRYSRDPLERSEARIQKQLELCQSPATWFPSALPIYRTLFSCAMMGLCWVRNLSMTESGLKESSTRSLPRPCGSKRTPEKTNVCSVQKGTDCFRPGT